MSMMNDEHVAVTDVTGRRCKLVDIKAKQFCSVFTQKITSTFSQTRHAYSAAMQLTANVCALLALISCSAIEGANAAAVFSPTAPTPAGLRPFITTCGPFFQSVRGAQCASPSTRPDFRANARKCLVAFNSDSPNLCSKICCTEVVNLDSATQQQQVQIVARDVPVPNNIVDLEDVLEDIASHNSIIRDQLTTCSRFFAVNPNAKCALPGSERDRTKADTLCLAPTSPQPGKPSKKFLCQRICCTEAASTGINVGQSTVGSVAGARPAPEKAEQRRDGATIPQDSAVSTTPIPAPPVPSSPFPPTKRCADFFNTASAQCADPLARFALGRAMSKCLLDSLSGTGARSVSSCSRICCARF